jgi:2-oxoglutarate dehydrogenase E2 component (dihydrolipoamide succinyltransferase)
VLRWLKAPGARVAANEPLVELETDKVTVEIPAPVGGVLQQILKGEGAEVAAGDLLGQIELDATASPPQPCGARPAARPGLASHGARGCPMRAARAIS